MKYFLLLYSVQIIKLFHDRCGIIFQHCRSVQDVIKVYGLKYNFVNMWQQNSNLSFQVYTSVP